MICEVTHFLEDRLGVPAELDLLGEFGSGTLEVEPVSTADWLRIAELVVHYRDLPLGTVDASIVAVAERLRIERLATLDRRHFSVVRPRHVEALTLLP